MVLSDCSSVRIVHGEGHPCLTRERRPQDESMNSTVLPFRGLLRWSVGAMGGNTETSLIAPPGKRKSPLSTGQGAAMAVNAALAVGLG